MSHTFFHSLQLHIFVESFWSVSTFVKVYQKSGKNILSLNALPWTNFLISNRKSFGTLTFLVTISFRKIYFSIKENEKKKNFKQLSILSVVKIHQSV